MADYAASASQIYDPQANAERTAAGTAKDSALSDIAAAKADLNPYYAQAFSKLTTGENNAHGQQTMTDNLAGLLDSGLHANQDQGITHQYAEDRSNLSTEQANKVANYDRQSANVNNSYQSALSAILDKYNGQKAAYVTDMQNKDSDRAFQQSLADKSAALSRELAASGNANALKIAGINAASYASQNPQKTPQQLATEYAINAHDKQQGSGDGYYRDHIKNQIDALYGKDLPAGFLNDLIYNKVYK